MQQNLIWVGDLTNDIPVSRKVHGLEGINPGHIGVITTHHIGDRNRR